MRARASSSRGRCHSPAASAPAARTACSAAPPASRSDSVWDTTASTRRMTDVARDESWALPAWGEGGGGPGSVFFLSFSPASTLLSLPPPRPPCPTGPRRAPRSAGRRRAGSRPRAWRAEEGCGCEEGWGEGWDVGGWRAWAQCRPTGAPHWKSGPLAGPQARGDSRAPTPAASRRAQRGAATHNLPPPPLINLLRPAAVQHHVDQAVVGRDFGEGGRAGGRGVGRPGGGGAAGARRCRPGRPHRARAEGGAWEAHRGGPGLCARPRTPPSHLATPPAPLHPPRDAPASRLTRLGTDRAGTRPRSER